MPLSSVSTSRFQPPPAEPCLHLLAHTALQLTRSFLVSLSFKTGASRSAFPSPLVRLSPFPLHQAFPDSLVGRHSYEYYGDSVALRVSPGRRSRIPVKSNVFAHLGPVCPQTPSLGATHRRERSHSSLQTVSFRCRRLKDAAVEDGYIVSDLGSANASPQVQPLAFPYTQGWRIRLHYILSCFSASGHATVPQRVFPPKSVPSP
jgi:hypothetical protein